jgi:osmotically-inducible protein OsmY
MQTPASGGAFGGRTPDEREDDMNLGTLLTRGNRRRPVAVNAGVVLASMAAGAAAATLLDPRAGARRRGLVVQKAIHAQKATTSFGHKAARDLANRSRGLLARARTSGHERQVLDDVLSERVRSRLGRLTSHSSAIEVTARSGVVELRGPVLEAEAARVVEGIHHVRGIREVVDRLERHPTAGHLRALQGDELRSGPVPELMKRSWAPGTRVAVVALGGVLAAAGLRSRRPAGVAMALAGSLLALRGATNLSALMPAHR